MKIWQQLEHTADFAFRIFGRDPEDLLQNARTAFYEAVFDEFPQSGKTSSQNFELHSPDQSLLVIDWLRELLYRLSVENKIIDSFQIIELSDTKFKAKCHMLKIKELSKEPFIKAVSYHNAYIVEKNCLLQIDVVCDV